MREHVESVCTAFVWWILEIIWWTFLLPNGLLYIVHREGYAPLTPPIKPHTMDSPEISQDYTVVSVQDSHLPPVHRYPVRFCKVSLMHTACSAQGSQVQAESIVFPSGSAKYL